MADDALLDRAKGALVGLAAGDAVGTTLEFSTRDAGPPLTDMIGGGPFDLQPGQWTDDTAMAIALATSLKERGGFDATDCMNRFVNWFRWGAYSCTGTCFDIGIATASALRRYEESGDPFSGSTDPRSAGNGSLMRLSPVAIWGALRDEELLAQVAREQSRTTHGSTECLDACQGYALLTARAIRGEAKADVLAPLSFVDAPNVATVFAGSWRGKARDAISSSGYVVDSLEAALWCVAQTDDFRSAVLLAANLGDDSDTVGAITGQLAGALYGRTGIPLEWLQRLAWEDELSTLATHLLDLT